MQKNKKRAEIAVTITEVSARFLNEKLLSMLKKRLSML